MRASPSEPPQSWPLKLVRRLSSPLLKQKLKGPVYLVSSKHKLPDLLADLNGQINIQLDGVIRVERAGD